MLNATNISSSEKQGTRFAHTDPFPPFAYSIGDESRGLVIDLVNAVSEKINLDVHYLPVNLNDLQTILKTGGVDAILPLAVTPEREKKYDFSDALLYTGGAIFPGNSGEERFDLASYEGRRVCTPKEGPLTNYIRETYPGVILKTVRDYPAALETVIKGGSDAAALNLHVGKNLIKKMFEGKFALPEESFIKTPLALAVLKGKKRRLLDAINRGLRDIKETGGYDVVLEKWI